MAIHCPSGDQAGRKWPPASRAMFRAPGSHDAAQDGKQAQNTTLDVALGNMYTREIESFGESLLNGTPLTAPASEAVQVQRVIEAAYRSCEEKRIIDL